MAAIWLPTNVCGADAPPVFPLRSACTVADVCDGRGPIVSSPLVEQSYLGHSRSRFASNGSFGGAVAPVDKLQSKLDLSCFFGESSGAAHFHS